MLQKILTGKGVMRAGKGDVRAREGFNNMDNVEKKSFSPTPFFKQYQD